MTTTMQTTAEGHEIIALHMADTSEVFITRSVNYKGRTVYSVCIAHVPPYTKYITWSNHYTEAEARRSANRAWKRYSGREWLIH